MIEPIETPHNMKEQVYIYARISTNISITSVLIWQNIKTVKLEDILYHKSYKHIQLIIHVPKILNIN